MKTKHLIFLPIVAAVALGFYTIFELNRRELANGAQNIWDNYLTDNLANEERRLALLKDMWDSGKYNPFYGERAKADRQKIYAETRGLDELELVRYVWSDGLLLDIAPSRWDVIRCYEDLDKRIEEQNARILNAASPEERAANLQIREGIRQRVTEWAAEYRETIALYRDGDPERFSSVMFSKSATAAGLDRFAEGESYFKWRSEGIGFQRFLCWTSHGIRRWSVDRAWSEIQGPGDWSTGHAQLLEILEHQHTTRHRDIISPIGWIGRDGLRHEWFYEFEVDRRDPAKVLGAKPGFVMVAKSGLSAAPNERYAKFMKREVYPKDSVLDLVLRRDEVKAAAKKAPVLKRVEVSYDVLRDHNLEQQPQGFSVVVDLVDSLKSEDVGRRLHFFVPSGLDSPLGVDGQPVERDYLPEDTLGEVRYLGGSEWGS